MLLITHDGTFHADDVLAYAILSEVHADRSPRLRRTRHQMTIEAARDAIVFDVGNVYDPGNRRYDHHMLDKAKREDGTPYSSVGLVWLHHGMELLRLRYPEAEEIVLSRAWRRIDERFIRPVDIVDNGVGKGDPNGFAALVDDFNPSWDDDDANWDDAFVEAAAFALSTFSRVADKALAAERAVAIVTKAASEADDPRIVVLPQSMPWEGTILKGGFDQALFVIYPHDNGTWYCTAVPPERGSHEQRLPLPQGWAALRDNHLAEVSGVPDAVFCHSACFVCGAGSLDGALALANEAIRLAPSAPGPR